MKEKRFLKKVAEEWLLLFTVLGTIITSLYLKRFPDYSKNDFKIIYTLLIFLIIIKSLENTGFFKNISIKFNKGKYLPQKLILLTAILSMFITNDIALLTIVPITIAFNPINLDLLIILETLTANIASTITPFGNPQNIFIYYYYHLHPIDFIKTIAPFSIILLPIILLLSLKQKTVIISYPKEEIKPDRFSYVYMFFFIIFILSILRLLPIEIGIFIAVFSFFHNKTNLKIDYFLLLTFLFFFGFTDNLIRIFKITFENPNLVFIYSCFGSQIISNVPGALFFADFTNNWKQLLWGVSVGGLGNLIGSLASLISYRFYKAKFPQTKKYLIKFYFYGYLFFLIGIIIYFVFYTLL